MFTHRIDEPWQKVAPLLPALPVRPDGKGRRWKDSLSVSAAGSGEDALKNVAHAFAQQAGLDLCELLHRRHVRLGKKGDDAAGKTRRGKGTKLMLIANRNGLPVTA